MAGVLRLTQAHSLDGQSLCINGRSNNTNSTLQIAMMINDSNTNWINKSSQKRWVEYLTVSRINPEIISQ
jgi:hypothetical protein